MKSGSCSSSHACFKASSANGLFCILWLIACLCIALESVSACNSTGLVERQAEVSKTIRKSKCIRTALRIEISLSLEDVLLVARIHRPHHHARHRVKS